MNPTEALTLIKECAAARNIRLPEKHVRQRRMPERRVSYEDIRRALMTATECFLQNNGRWKLSGFDLDNDELTCIVVLEDSVVVVTVF